MTQPSSIAARIEIIRQQIPPGVKLLAVSKQVSSSQIREAYAAGVRDFGESRVQEAIAKHAELQDLPDLTWHFIGRLQANKARKVVEHFQWIHSVDSLDLALRLNRIAQEQERHPQTCLQVKIIPDPSKQGWSKSDLLTDLPALGQLQNLNICGLMVIPPLTLNDQQLNNLFEQAQKLLDSLRDQPGINLHMQELSMGMSGDYLLAIRHGATIIRLGQTIFGKRL